MNILLAEDDDRLGELVAHMLKKKAGYRVDWVMTGEDAYDYAKAAHYDIVILDWMMPGGDGVEACRRLRRSGYTGAVLMLTAKDALQDRIEGLDAGADDYLVKPFEIDELLARLRALSRRNYAPLKEETVTIGGILLNRTGCTVQLGEETIQLTPREFQLLDLLACNKGQVLSREVLLDRIWGYDAEVSAKTVDATVKLLRKKLEPLGGQELVQSVRGVGYKLED
ncbi:response regulator transcription factor [Paenibacillus mucilaginosus]|uniref:Winged helix family two component transcriptional regulator n=3 Tax=Paenibacillus mucilaginosus TaxID=61624 RepID=H6NRD7_9BACL|nr:response regulator transcription factor [Paenibacillus mucilaginosus]AEI45932.1 two component transcriptional regulator, winged helix family [Paenibacillus mucilaginosus KNP414]AFC33572.1 winged helix family two component transcriptional regulator [Paenibacillus mucilaginosus 3016]AFH65894.1 regulator [Paenibacillus mucilaginosus K02]MCG7216794.1 response regulator transcription factor [Paenibacillus mucilaginosus]WDM27284.1 response regulator transcription factor [Paenibacillus mucilaginos